MERFGLRRQRTPESRPRDHNRFDRFDAEDLYTAYESAVATALASMDAARGNPDHRDLHLQNTQAHLETAVQVVESMRSRGL